ncbi:hypothetical protein GJ496_006728 [Pomphorhynchus laevis]|nr:hypothetical protein GJ496_006728 [Pomphorhynchus laevis]
MQVLKLLLLKRTPSIRPFLRCINTGYTIARYQTRLLTSDCANNTCNRSDNDKINYEIKSNENDMNSTEKEIQELKQNMEDIKDKYLRALAESENTRSRLHRQIHDAKQYGVQALCKDLIAIVDDLQRALSSVDRSALAENKPLSNLTMGLDIILLGMQSTFKKYGLQEIETNVGQPFDPAFHEAVFQVSKSENTPDSHCIFNVVQTGYKLHDRVIRAAKVAVVE